MRGLIVENDSFTRKWFATGLELDLPSRVIALQSVEMAREAMNITRTEVKIDFDFICTDYHLEDGTAEDIVRSAREILDIMPSVVIFTGSTDESIAEWCSDEGFMYLQKPIMAEGLVRAVRRAVEQNQRQAGA